MQAVGNHYSLMDSGVKKLASGQVFKKRLFGQTVVDLVVREQQSVIEPQQCVMGEVIRRRRARSQHMSLSCT